MTVVIAYEQVPPEQIRLAVTNLSSGKVNHPYSIPDPFNAYALHIFIYSMTFLWTNIVTTQTLHPSLSPDVSMGNSITSFPHLTRRLVAVVRTCATNGDDATLHLVTYTKYLRSSLEVIELSAIGCVVGRVGLIGGKQWDIIDRSKDLVRPSFVEDPELISEMQGIGI